MQITSNEISNTKYMQIYLTEEELKPIIETIFKLYVEKGYGFQKISEILNAKYNYPTPSAYYRRKHLELGRVVFENHHEPIISKEIFNLTQEIRKNKILQEQMQKEIIIFWECVSVQIVVQECLG